MSASAPAVAATMSRWHEMIDTLDLSEVDTLMSKGVLFRSPAFWKPYDGPEKVAHVLQTVMSIFEDFTYHREFATGGGQDVVLEFSARVGDLELKGIDMIGFDDGGLIAQFEVMIRPMKSLQLVAERMRDSLDLTVLGLA